jgi:hypothetical protein
MWAERGYKEVWRARFILGGTEPRSAMKANALALGGLLLALATLGAVPANAQVGLGGTILNIAPLITSVTVGSSFNPTAGTTTNIPVTTVITDGNGCPDLTTSPAAITVAIYTSANVLSVSPVTLAYSSCGLLGATTFTGNVPMQFYTAAGTYKVQVSATDAAGSNIIGSLSISPVTFTWTSLVAMTSASSFSFGTTLNPGDLSTVGSGVSVTNKGNAQIDTQVSGTALTLASPSASIPVGNVAYSLSNTMSPSTALTGSAAPINGFDLAAGSSSSRPIYVQLTVPSVDDQYLPAGAYTGTLTITAVSG